MRELGPDLDAAATVRLLECALRRRRQAEVDDLSLVLHFADLHSAIPAPTTPGGETLGDLGGEGTPGVGSLALIELGVARQVHPIAARKVIADALDLRHRLPLTWAVVQSLDAEVWLARRVATMTRALSYDQVGLVDSAVADAIAGQAPSRVLGLAEAKIIEADLAAHEARLAAERSKRFVGQTRLDGTGHRTLYARIASGEAHHVLATVQQIADRLALLPEHAGLSADELRAEAFGWLSRPEDVRALLEGQAAPLRHRTKAVLYLHLHQATLEGIGGLARVEGLDPHTLDQLRRLLGHDHIIVKPVIDLTEEVSVTAYEHPEAIKERIHLRYGGDAFPHASQTTRNLDIDHIKSYNHDPGAPPGQTGTHTSQPLSRTPHRAETHLAYRCRRLRTGETLWTTPHGLHRLVDHTGTHLLDPDEYASWTSPDPLEQLLTHLVHRLDTDRAARHG